MTLTLLFDLDDTLLNSNIAAFIPAYFQSLSKWLADYVAPEKMLAALMQGTRAMMANEDPALTLRQVFDAEFFPKIGIERSVVQPAIDRFYEEAFTALGSLTKQVPEAIRLVKWAFAQGHRVAIATDPMFPLSAIQHRLRWAGLPPEEYPFAIVTSYESFHFTKGKVAYYPELLAQLGWPADPVVMIGDDLEREVKPTQAAGLPMFWVRQNGNVPAEFVEVPQGPLESFQGWLEGADLGGLQYTFRTPEAILACLRSTPAAIATLTATLSSDAWLQTPQPGEWCLTEVLCHLRDVEREVHQPRFRKVLTEANPFIAGEVTDRWVQDRQYAKQDGRRALVEFTSARKETLTMLAGVTEWSRSCRHAIFGPTTLLELVGFLAEHDRAHIQQVWKSIS
jgi:FMN phosphatase YigB (HAD superfamily)